MCNAGAVFKHSMLLSPTLVLHNGGDVHVSQFDNVNNLAPLLVHDTKNKNSADETKKRINSRFTDQKATESSIVPKI